MDEAGLPPPVGAPGDGRVTIYVPTYNQSAYLAQSVLSAVRQTVRPAAVIVGDDASTDDTPSVMAALTAAHGDVVEYRRYEANVGIAANNARLAESVGTEFTMRLDSDDFLEDSYLAELLPLMRANPTAGYGHGAIRRVDADGNPFAEMFLNRRRGFVGADDALRAGVAGYRVAGNVVLYRTAALRQMNWFHGRPDYVEDYDMSVRQAAAGWGNVYSDRIVANSRCWDDPGGQRARRKSLELSGYRRIFDEVFTPAFAARGWDTAPLARQRRRLASTHAPRCFLPPFTAAERDRLVVLLRELGDGPALRLKLGLLSLGLAPALERLHHGWGGTKNRLKRLLALRRGGGGDPTR